MVTVFVMSTGLRAASGMVATGFFSSSFLPSSFLLSSFFGAAGAFVFPAAGAGTASSAARNPSAEIINSIQPILMRQSWTISVLAASPVFGSKGEDWLIIED